MSNPTYLIWWLCDDCGGQGWYPWQPSPDLPEPEQMQCNTCNGFGYVEQPDEPITPEALEREGWKQLHPDATYFGNSPEGLRVRIWDDGVAVHHIAWRQDYPNCKTMPQLRALVEMLGGAQ